MKKTYGLLCVLMLMSGSLLQVEASEIVVETEVQPYSVTTGPVDGGYWIRGKRDNAVISEYMHYTQSGYASVVNGLGYTSNGGWQAKNVYSRANQSWSFWGTNKSYYNNR